MESKTGRNPGLEDADLQEPVRVGQERPPVATDVRRGVLAVVVAVTFFGEQASQPLAA